MTSRPGSDEDDADGTPRWLLAIDTSSDQAGVALFDGERLWLRSWPCLRAQTTQVPGAIAALLADAGLATTDVAGVAVATGPGTFTGLRVGLSLAKGFAYAASLPIVGVPTLEATAAPWTIGGRRVVAVVPAGRGRLVWQALPGGEPRNTTPDDFLAWVGDHRVDAVVGELDAALRAMLDGLPVPLVTGALAPPRVGAVAAIGHARLVRGESDDLAPLAPQYVHGQRVAVAAVVDPTP